MTRSIKILLVFIKFLFLTEALYSQIEDLDYSRTVARIDESAFLVAI